MELIQNFNGLELLFIIILAILLFGPEKIPEIALKVGRFLRAVREYSSDMMADMREETGLDEVSRESKNLGESLNRNLQELRSSITMVDQPESSRSSSQPDPPPSNQTDSEVKTGAASKPQRENLEKQLQELEDQLTALRSQLAEQEQIRAEDKHDR